MQQDGVNLPPEVRQATALSDYAVEARYPGLAEPVTRQEYLEAILMAEAVVKWAARLLGVG
jgi:hypothetical protein